MTNGTAEQTAELGAADARLEQADLRFAELCEVVTESERVFVALDAAIGEALPSELAELSTRKRAAYDAWELSRSALQAAATVARAATLARDGLRHPEAVRELKDNIAEAQSALRREVEEGALGIALRKIPLLHAEIRALAVVSPFQPAEHWASVESALLAIVGGASKP